MNPTPVWLKKLVKLPDLDFNLKTFGGHRQKVPLNWKVSKETHFAFEIMLIISGTQLTQFEGRQTEFYEGDIILIPPGVAHANTCISKEGMEYFCIHFDLNDIDIQQQLLMYCPILLHPENLAYGKIASILTSYTDMLEIGEFTVRERIKIEVLILELMNSLLDYVESEKKVIAHSDNTTILLAKEIAEVIQMNFKEYTNKSNRSDKDLLSMEKIAETLNISKSTMLKAFKKIYACSPKSYLDQLRFSEAKFLLHQPKVSVSEIAEIIGYENAAHFTRQFKKWSTLSPRSYRNLYLKI